MKNHKHWRFLNQNVITHQIHEKCDYDIDLRCSPGYGFTWLDHVKSKRWAQENPDILNELSEILIARGLPA